MRMPPSHDDHHRAGASHDPDLASPEAIARRMVTELPRFGSWASAIRDFETPHGKVGLRQLAILWLIRYDTFGPEPLSATSLAVHFQVQPSVITKALTRLETSGLITRTVDPADSRRSLIAITEPGIEVSRYVEDLFIADMMDSLSRVESIRWDELARALDVLEAVGDDLVRKLGQTRKPTRQRRQPRPILSQPDTDPDR
ncbi:MAG TPA: MarR family transcriptional regulator [Thermomicrobiales bacterium]|jgi:DNA-binding MarR family transcriptional regulator|nr:MarR family transcriptional regulator [Thermomicrobiales bacterium]